MNKIILTALASLVLSACASGPSDNLTLISPEINQQSSKQGAFTQDIKIDAKRPGCSGECPRFVVNSLVFPGNPKLTNLVERGLVYMTWLDSSRAMPYATIPEFEQYYWKTAANRDYVDLTARTRYRTKNLTVIELNVGQYNTGMAHGISGSQFINWDIASGLSLGLDNFLITPSARHDFDEQLNMAYQQWLKDNDAYRNDPDNYLRMWPFVSSDNVALTDIGLVVKYQPYEIAPYSFGQPELTIPYTKLKGIFRNRYLPPNI